MPARSAATPIRTTCSRAAAWPATWRRAVHRPQFEGGQGRPENNLLLVRGAVPGPNGGYVVIRQTNKL